MMKGITTINESLQELKAGKNFIRIDMKIRVVLLNVFSIMSASESFPVGSGNTHDTSLTPFSGMLESNVTSSNPVGSPSRMVITPPLGCVTPIAERFYIFDGHGEISLNGNDFSKNSSVTVTGGDSYSISDANLGSEYSLYEWLASSVTVSRIHSSSTTFVPSSGTLTMILSSSVGRAGYKETSSGSTRASAIIDVPSSISCVQGVTSAKTSTKMVGFWVGLCGDPTVSGLENNIPWQAGGMNTPHANLFSPAFNENVAVAWSTGWFSTLTQELIPGTTNGIGFTTSYNTQSGGL